MNQLVNRLASNHMDVNKLAILLLYDAPCKRDAMLDKDARRLVSRYLLMIPWGERDGNAHALQRKRKRLGAVHLPLRLRLLSIIAQAWVVPATAQLLHK